jgi:hypothetical protein
MKTRHILPTLGFVLTALTTVDAQAYAVSDPLLGPYFGEYRQNSSTTIPTASAINNGAIGNAEFSFLYGLSYGSSVYTETFENRAVGVTSNLSLAFTGSNGSSINATLASQSPAGNGGVNQAVGSSNQGRYSAPGGVKYWEADLALGSFTVTFDKAVAAFGFFGTDIGDFGGALSLDVYNGSTLIKNLAVGNSIGDGSGGPNGTDGSALYYGFIAQNSGELFNKVTFRTTLTTSADMFGFDNFTVADAGQAGIVVPTVPEPGTIALVGAALLGAGLARRRRA